MTEKQHFVEAVLETVTDYAEAQRLVRMYTTDEMVAALIGVSKRLNDTRKRLEVCQIETAKARAMFEMAVKQLVAIKSFIHPEGIMVEGKGYSFHPPDALVREAWEALSSAIREIDVEKLARGE